MSIHFLGVENSGKTTKEMSNVSISPRLAKSGVRAKSTMMETFVIEDTIVEQSVIQKASPYVKPSSKRCSTPKVVTAMILIISAK